MKKAVTYILSAVVIALAVAYLVVCLGLVREKRQDTLCTGLNVIVLDSVHTSFITAGDVGRHLDREYGKYIGLQIDSINLTRIEDIIDSKSAVFKSQAYVSTDGILNIRISQRTPLLLFKTDSAEYFADAEEFIFPMQGRGTDRVITVTGSIPLTVGKDFKGDLQDEAQTEWLTGIVAMAQHIRKYHVWEDVAVSVQENGDIILSPKREDVSFIFGEPKDIQRKFSRINKYYLAVVPDKGEDHYSSVNVKYAGQLVCRTDGKDKKKEEARKAAEKAAAQAAKAQEDSTKRQEQIDAAQISQDQEESMKNQPETAAVPPPQTQEEAAQASQTQETTETEETTTEQKDNVE